MADNQWLEETYCIDYNNQSIQSLVKKLITNEKTTRAQALTFYRYLRDSILFGFEPNFYDMKASEVLAAKRGFCTTKSTLFIALLRAVNIPARHHFVALSSHILDGIIDPRTPYVDHSYVEIKLDSVWIPVDSFIVDRGLFNVSKSLLKKPLGLGIRQDAVNDWDGFNPSFCQYHPSYILKDFGVFNDVGDFYKNCKNPNNKLTILSKLLFYLSVNGANKKIQALRNKKF